MSTISFKIPRFKLDFSKSTLVQLINTFFISFSILLPTLLLLSLIDLNRSEALTYILIYSFVTLAYIFYSYLFHKALPKEPKGFLGILAFSFLITLLGLVNFPQSSAFLNQRTDYIVFSGTFYMMLIISYFGLSIFATPKRLLAQGFLLFAVVEAMIFAILFLKLIGVEIYVFQPAILLLTLLLGYLFFHLYMPKFRKWFKLIFSVYFLTLVFLFNNILTAPIAILFLFASLIFSIRYILKKYKVKITTKQLCFSKNSLTKKSAVYSLIILLLNLGILLTSTRSFLDAISILQLEISKLNFTSVQSVLIGSGMERVLDGLPFVWNLMQVGGIVVVVAFLYYIFSPYFEVSKRTHFANIYLLISIVMLFISGLLLIDFFVVAVSLFFSFFFLNFGLDQKSTSLIYQKNTTALDILNQKVFRENKYAKLGFFILLIALLMLAFIFLVVGIFRM